MREKPWKNKNLHILCFCQYHGTNTIFRKSIFLIGWYFNSKKKFNLKTLLLNFFFKFTYCLHNCSMVFCRFLREFPIFLKTGWKYKANDDYWSKTKEGKKMRNFLLNYLHYWDSNQIIIYIDCNHIKGFLLRITLKSYTFFFYY